MTVPEFAFPIRFVIERLAGMISYGLCYDSWNLLGPVVTADRILLRR